MDLSPIIFGIILSSKNKVNNLGRSQNNFRSPGENTKVHTIKILLDSGASDLIVRKNVLSKYHNILKNKTSNWSTMAGMFNIYYVTNFNLKLSELFLHCGILREMPFNKIITQL